ncbi:MAG: FxsA family protein [Thiotrichales bacterium]
MPLLFVFIIVPIIELYLLIKVGSWIGVFPTILIVILTAAIGTWLLRQQGGVMLRRYQQTLAAGKMPAQEMIEGLALVFGGALLLTPGFFTDAIGFLCLLPPTRQFMIRAILSRVKFNMVGAASSSVFTQRRGTASHDTTKRHQDQGRTIEGEYTVEDQDKDDRF